MSTLEGRLGSVPFQRNRSSAVNAMENGEEEGKEGGSSRLLTEDEINAANSPAVAKQAPPPPPPPAPEQKYHHGAVARAPPSTPTRTKVCLVVTIIGVVLAFTGLIVGFTLYNRNETATPVAPVRPWRNPEPVRVQPVQQQQAPPVAIPVVQRQPAPFAPYVAPANRCACSDAVKNNAWRVLEETWRQHAGPRTVETWFLRPSAKCYCDGSQPKIEGRGQQYRYIGPSRGVSFRVNLPAGDVERLVMNNYIPVYHGTNPRAVSKIIPSNEFLKPTDPRVRFPDGRPAVNVWNRWNEHTNQWERLDRGDVVFTSRSFLYALGYSRPRFGGGEVTINGERYRIVIQALQREGSYRIGQETLMNQVNDPRIDRREVEFYTTQPQFIKPYKVIVVKVRPGED